MRSSGTLTFSVLLLVSHKNPTFFNIIAIAKSTCPLAIYKYIYINHMIWTLFA